MLCTTWQPRCNQEQQNSLVERCTRRGTQHWHCFAQATSTALRLCLPASTVNDLTTFTLNRTDFALMVDWRNGSTHSSGCVSLLRRFLRSHRARAGRSSVAVHGWRTINVKCAMRRSKSAYQYRLSLACRLSIDRFYPTQNHSKFQLAAAAATTKRLLIGFIMACYG